MIILRIAETINALPDKVWSIMLADETYRQWTKAFHPNSYFEGDWSSGSEMRFLATEENGKTGGMFSVIKESDPPRFLSIEHRGLIADGKVDTESEEVKKWAPAYENYTLTEKNGQTELLIEMQMDESHREMFEKMWNTALKDLKTLCEK